MVHWWLLVVLGVTCVLVASCWFVVFMVVISNSFWFFMILEIFLKVFLWFLKVLGGVLCGSLIFLMFLGCSCFFFVTFFLLLVFLGVFGF